MGRSRAEKARIRSHTLPSSPSHSFSSSSSSSDFEFRISLSPPNKSLCPADDLFYKGKLLPLHLSPRLSMVRTLLLASSSTSSSSDTATSASRDSSGSCSSSDVVLFADYNCDSSRPSSVADLEDDFMKRPLNGGSATTVGSSSSSGLATKKSRKFSLAKFSSVFIKKKPENNTEQATSAAQPRSVKKMSASARDVFRKYLKKVKPLYEKLSSQKQQKIDGTTSLSASLLISKEVGSGKSHKEGGGSSSSGNGGHPFSGNLWYIPRRRGVVASCPSSMRSSPSHSGVLTGTGFPSSSSVDSSMEELQNAIQGAIAHCKNSMMVTNRSGPLGQY